MVVPWIGFPLSALINQVQPGATPKYVEFVTLADRLHLTYACRFWTGRMWKACGFDRGDASPLTLLTFGAFGEFWRHRTERRCALPSCGSTACWRRQADCQDPSVEKEPRTAYRRPSVGDLT